MGICKKISPQLKVGSLRFAIELGRPVAQVARKLQINGGTLEKWIQA